MEQSENRFRYESILTYIFVGLEKIVSGGETGADRAGLEAGKELGIATGG